MKKIILALLVAKFQGVRKDGLSVMAGILALQAATEEEAKNLVDKLTDAQVNEFIKDYRKDVDKEVSESNKTLKPICARSTISRKRKPNPAVTRTRTRENLAEIVKAAVAAAVKPFEESCQVTKQEPCRYKACPTQ
jgi:hypothetical protein